MSNGHQVPRSRGGRRHASVNSISNLYGGRKIQEIPTYYFILVNPYFLDYLWHILRRKRMRTKYQRTRTGRTRRDPSHPRSSLPQRRERRRSNLDHPPVSCPMGLTGGIFLAQRALDFGMQPIRPGHGFRRHGIGSGRSRGSSPLRQDLFPLERRPADRVQRQIDHQQHQRDDPQRPGVQRDQPYL